MGIERFVQIFNAWLSSPSGLIQAIILSFLWNIAVILNWDAHGFLYLFIATEFSFITQFNLAYLARRAQAEAHSVSEYNEQLLKNTQDMLQYMIVLGERLQEGQDAQDELLEEIHEEVHSEHIESNKILSMVENQFQKNNSTGEL